jgi:hypothetical protein
VPDHLDVDPVALAAAARVVAGAQLVTSPPSLTAATVGAEQELAPMRSAAALAGFASAWQRVLQRLGDRANSIAVALSTASADYSAVEQAIARAAGSAPPGTPR